MAEKQQKSKVDVFIWLFTVILFGAGLAANYYYGSIALPIRAIGWIVIFGAMLGIAAMTSQGKRVIAFSREARTELRKVVWPNRKETVQTTIMVVVLVLIMGVILWGLDSALLWAIGWLTGQRG